MTHSRSTARGRVICVVAIAAAAAGCLDAPTYNDTWLPPERNDPGPAEPSHWPVRCPPARMAFLGVDAPTQALATTVEAPDCGDVMAFHVNASSGEATVPFWFVIKSENNTTLYAGHGAVHEVALKVPAPDDRLSFLFHYDGPHPEPDLSAAHVLVSGSVRALEEAQIWSQRSQSIPYGGPGAHSVDFNVESRDAVATVASVGSGTRSFVDPLQQVIATAPQDLVFATAITGVWRMDADAAVADDTTLEVITLGP